MSIWQTVWYRSTQFFAALWANTHPPLAATDREWLDSILTTPAQRDLFLGMSANDQRHGLAVARTLQQVGQTELALLQAGLLHDVGKSLGQPIIHRVLIVLLTAFWPALLTRLARSCGLSRSQAHLSGNYDHQPARSCGLSRSQAHLSGNYDHQPARSCGLSRSQAHLSGNYDHQPARSCGLSRSQAHLSGNYEPSHFWWWRRPFVIHAQHPAIGASWAAATDCEPLASRLIARHQDRVTVIWNIEDRLLLWLQWADNLN